MKHFGKIEGLRKHTFAARGAIRSWDFDQAKYCDRVYFVMPGRLAAVAKRGLRMDGRIRNSSFDDGAVLCFVDCGNCLTHTQVVMLVIHTTFKNYPSGLTWKAIILTLT